jgi:hypothetical protein
MIEIAKRTRARLRWSWRYPVLVVLFLPVLFAGGGCPDLSGAAADAHQTLLWFCPLAG